MESLNKRRGIMVEKYIKFLKKPDIHASLTFLSFILSGCLLISSAAWAQEAGALSGILTRLENLETANRALEGKVEDMTHALNLLQEERGPTKEKHEAPLRDVHNMTEEVGVEQPPLIEPASPAEEYGNALTKLEEGDYEGAEAAFAAFLDAHPKDALAGQAQYWLGVTFFAREDYEKAAASFAKGHKLYPKSSKASHNLLKLAESLHALGRDSDACTTLEELSTHPKASARDVSDARRKFGCK